MYYHYGKFIGGCPLLGGYKCTITMGRLSSLFLEVTNVLSLWEVRMTCPLFRGCPLFRVSTIRGSRCHTHLDILQCQRVPQYHDLSFLLKLVQLLIGQGLDSRSYCLKLRLHPLAETLTVRVPAELNPVFAVLRGQGQSPHVEFLQDVLGEVAEVLLGGGVTMDHHQLRQGELQEEGGGGAG